MRAPDNGYTSPYRQLSPHPLPYQLPTDAGDDSNSHQI
jgi:hypothetical protein